MSTPSMSTLTPRLPVAEALERRRLLLRTPAKKYPSRKVLRITDEASDEPIATLELYGLSTSIIDVLEKFGGVTYLSEVRYWTDADFCRVKNVGNKAVANYRTALARFLRGAPEVPGFNTVNADSTAAVRDGYWYPISSDVKGLRQRPWTPSEYRNRMSGLLPDGAEEPPMLMPSDVNGGQAP